MRGSSVVLLAALLLLLPLTLALPPPLPAGDNDAGSGADAPDEPDPGFVVGPDALYEGTISYTEADPLDHYAFFAEAGQSVHARADGFHGCVYILGPMGDEVSDICAFGQEGRYSLWAQAAETGIHYLRIDPSVQLTLNFAQLPSEHTTYRFIFTLDGVAPSTDAIPDGNPFTNDADSGHDAPDIAVPLVLVGDQARFDGFVGYANGDRADWYAFEGLAGQVVEVSAYAASSTCIDIRAGTGDEGPCASRLLDIEQETLGLALRRLTHTLTHDGVSYIYITGLHSHYGIGLGIDAPAPSPGVPGEAYVPSVPPLLPQDDAGSGADAPGNDSVVGPTVQPGTVYEGILEGALSDHEDRYAFTANAGQPMHVRVFGLQGCAGFYGPDGDEIAFSCHVIQNGIYSVFARAPTDGVYHLYAAATSPAAYRFAFMLDDYAPDPAPVPLPPEPWANDAGSGQDAPDIRVPLLPITTGTYLGAAPLIPDFRDWYLLEATEGQTVEVIQRGSAGCVAIWHVDEEIDYTCAIPLGQLEKTTTRVLDRPGEWYLYASDIAGPYQLSVGIDQDAPAWPTLPV